MAFPVLATDVGGNSEIVKNDHGILIERDFDVETVAGIIDDYFDQDTAIHKRYRDNAFAFWTKHYSAEKNYMEFVDHLNRE